MTESVVTCADYCNTPSSKQDFSEHQEPTFSRSNSTSSNCENKDPCSGHEANAIKLKMASSDDRPPVVIKLVKDNMSSNNASPNSASSFAMLSSANNMVVSEAFIKKCSKVVPSHNNDNSEKCVETHISNDNDLIQSYERNSRTSVKMDELLNCKNIVEPVNTSHNINGPVSLPVKVTETVTEKSPSAVPKRRISMLPKPEISPKPAHLISMSPVRFQTTGYDSTTNNTSYHSLVNPNHSLNNQQMCRSLHCPSSKKLYTEVENNLKNDPSQAKLSTSAKAISQSDVRIYPLGISSSCTTISTIDDSAMQPPVNADSGCNSSKSVKDSKTSEKTKGTASMLKSTLKRMSRLSLRTTGGSAGSSPRSMSPFSFRKSSSPTHTQSNNVGQPNSNIPISKVAKTKRTTLLGSNDIDGKQRIVSNISSLNRQNSKKKSGIGIAHIVSGVEGETASKTTTGPQNGHAGAPGQYRSLSRSTSNSSSSSNLNNVGNHPNSAYRSNSLKRASRNKDLGASQKPINGNSPLQRSGSSSGTTTSRDVKRSNSMHHQPQKRTFRDRDLNVKYSRGVQTQLTKDAASIEDDIELSDTNFQENGIIPTNIEFSLYMPDLLGASGNDDFEAHVTEPTEPVDVRRNRQLQLDNMKLHREIEKLKSAANDSDNLKRELRQVRSRLEEEQRSRAKIEHELDQHNEKVKLIARSMDSVEQEFEFRDANIQQLETGLNNTKTLNLKLEEKLKNANELIIKQKTDLSDAIAGQQAAVKEYESAETEAAELHEFLQAEKATLTETLKESEQEVLELKTKVVSAEERCGQVVRLSEQRHQEILALEAQLSGVENRAKEMLLAQGAEMSQGTVHIAELGSKIKEYFKLFYPSSYCLEDTDLTYNGENSIKNNGSLSCAETNNASQLVCDNLERGEKIERVNSIISPNVTINGDVSLQNLSNAIQNRKKISESNTSPKNSKQKSRSSLVESINNIDKMLSKLLELGRSEIAKRQTPNGEVENPKKETNKVNGTEESQSNIHKNTCQHHEEIADLKAKFVRHKNILKSNYEQAENEVVRLDEIYHDTVSMVLEAFEKIPNVVKTSQDLLKLQQTLQTALLEAEQESPIAHITPAGKDSILKTNAE